MLNRRRCLFALCGLMLMATAPLSAPAQSNSKEIMALPAADLVALLQKPDAGEFEKAKACQRLAVVGTKDAIPALVALLPDEKLNFYARFGLEGIPDPAVDDALRDAAGRLTGRQQVGVIDSIGQRRDAKSVELLKGLLTNSDAIVASAAAGAVGPDRHDGCRRCAEGWPEPADAFAERRCRRDARLRGTTCDHRQEGRIARPVLRATPSRCAQACEDSRRGRTTTSPAG